MKNTYIINFITQKKNFRKLYIKLYTKNDNYIKVG